MDWISMYILFIWLFLFLVSKYPTGHVNNDLHLSKYVEDNYYGNLTQRLFD